MRAGLFVGLATVDVVHRISAPVAANTKVIADEQELAAGGPASNAAVTFAALGGRARLVTALGRHPFARYAMDDLTACGVGVLDAAPERTAPPPVSSIRVVTATGERSVASVNAAGVRAGPPVALDEAVAAAGVVLIDGHHPELAMAAARLARAHGVCVILDGGSWKPVMEDLLPFVDVAICSADFRAPGAASGEDSLAEMLARGVPAVAVTRGALPVLWRSGSRSGNDSATGEVAVPTVAARDTLGAGDALHGAFAYAIVAAPGSSFVAALEFAGRVASLRCTVPGTRAWLKAPALAELVAARGVASDR
jgi:sugar/nucleoside kinase (ribokinase family)